MIGHLPPRQRALILNLVANLFVLYRQGLFGYASFVRGRPFHRLWMNLVKFLERFVP